MNQKPFNSRALGGGHLGTLATDLATDLAAAASACYTDGELMVKSTVWQKHIHVDPRILGGKPVIRGTRVPVQVIVGGLSAGMTPAEVGKEYRVSKEAVRAALAYAAEMLAQ